jgi:hypothetical protein
MWIQTDSTCQLPYQEEVMTTQLTEPSEDNTTEVCNIDPIYIADGEVLPEASQYDTNATSINLNTVYATTIKYSDYYSVDVQKGHKYAISLTNGEYSYSSIYFSIKDPNGKYAKTSTSLALDYKGEYTFESLTDGKAIINIYGATKGKDYDINLAVYNATEDGLKQNSDTFEPNGAYAVSYPMVFDQVYSSSIVEGESHDMYRFDVKKGKSYSIEISNLDDSEGYLSLSKIYSEEEDKVLVLSSTVSIGTSKVYTFTASKDSTVQVWLYDSTSKNHDNYTIVASQETGHGHNHDPQTYEPNGSSISAYPIKFNEELNTTLDAKVDYQDVYVIDAAQDKSYTVRVLNKTGNYSNVNVYAVLANTNTELINTTLSSTSANTTSYYDVYIGSAKAWTFTNDKADSKVYIYLWSDDKTKQNDYTIAIESNDENLTHNSTTLEPNDSSGSAFPIEINKAYDSELTANVDYRDVYVIDGKAGESYTVNVSNKVTSYSNINVYAKKVDTNTELINTTLSSTSANTTSYYDVYIDDTKSWSFDIGANDSKVYVYLWADNFHKTNDYTVQISSNDIEMEHNSTTYEPNQGSADAYPLNMDSNNTTISSQLEALDTKDTFKFYAPAYSKYTLTLTNDDTSNSNINVYAKKVDTNTELINTTLSSTSANTTSYYDVYIGSSKSWIFENSTGNPSDIIIYLSSDDKSKLNSYEFTLERIEE